jgi:hypothetical protein
MFGVKISSTDFEVDKKIFFTFINGDHHFEKLPDSYKLRTS